MPDYRIKNVWGGQAIYDGGRCVVVFQQNKGKRTFQYVLAEAEEALRALESGETSEAALTMRSSRQRERQETRRRGKYARYDSRCEVCEAGISSQECQVPDTLLDEIDRIGFVPTLCDRCYAKAQRMSREEALAFVNAS